MKLRNLAVAALILMLPSILQATTTYKRVSILYLHRSVGLSICQNCRDPRLGAQPRNIRDVLDTLKVLTLTGPTDTLRADFVFRQGDLNGIPGVRLSQTTYTGDCGEVTVSSDYYQGSSFKIYYNTGCPLLSLFSDASRAQSTDVGTYAYDVFKNHQVRNSATDPTDISWEKYDLVIAKNPYACWMVDPSTNEVFNQARADKIKGWYRAIRDTVLKHSSDYNFVADFGTPLVLNHDGADSTRNKLVWRLANWFRDTLMAELPTQPAKQNFFPIEYYTTLIETGNQIDKYCLKQTYWAQDGASHLSDLGQGIAQDALVTNIKAVTLKMLQQEAGIVTRTDIDLKIKDFREGRATATEVIDLISRYIAGN